MDTTDFVRQRVERYYRVEDINCALTSIRILAEVFGFEIVEQVYHAAVGLGGAGKYRAQCGLVEGPIMFLGIAGAALGFDRERIEELCREFAGQFEKRFGSLSCRVLRPQGFDPDNPPHICEPISVDAVVMSIEFVGKALGRPARTT